ncbi:helix-hairpin-helix domain-containing protein [uncultured Bifidobacterium sp.]|uniref:ComEA family DNA-binding protein n=1 Tax=uncultured Bifidobacterium sp. TaxID=165187 RepID=UPI002624901F|nr:helix-hairpin-helix domain-containing protein [uncultured Bifidobacterium sp.]
MDGDRGESSDLLRPIDAVAPERFDPPGLSQGNAPASLPNPARGRTSKAFGPVQAVAVMMVLLCALSASVTMLITQAMNYSAAASATVSRTVAGTEATGISSGGAAEDSIPQSSGTATESSTPAASTSTASASASENTTIDINSADESELDELPGVGPVLASRIVEYRQSIGRFTSIDQLLDVSGIGSKTMERLRPLVSVS